MLGKMCRIKTTEINLLHQRNERLQRIQHDINILEGLTGKKMSQFDVIPSLELIDTEDPASLFETGNNNENNTQPSQQSKQSAQLNREQSFYDRALDEMMNGVLEVCWEDELKKDLPMPECLQEQTSNIIDHSILTANQRAQIKIYMEMIEKLRTDRIAYIDKLFEERSSLSQAREHQIRQVNRCIENISKSRIQAEFAILMEELRISMCAADRMKWLEFGKQKRLLAYVSLQKSILHLGNLQVFNIYNSNMYSGQREATNSSVEKWLAVRQQFEQNAANLKTHIDELNAKDQQLDRQSRQFFGEAVPSAVVEQASRIFK